MSIRVKELATLVRLILAVALFCSSLYYSMPIAEASLQADDAAVASVEHDHSASAERVLSISKSFSSEADLKECAPDGKSHNVHGNSSSDCCAAVCFDLTILASAGHDEVSLLPVFSADFPQSVLAVGPYRLLRPPRA